MKRYSLEAAGAGDLGSVIFKAEDVGPCPSCGATVSMTRAANPHNHGELTAALIHPVPFCHYFGITPSEAILAAIRGAV
jgi:hypothetical protein